MDSPLKWPGGKHYLAKKIVALMPPHIHYVEPYAGSLAVLLHKNPEGVSEVANDLNAWLMKFWDVMQQPEYFQHFQRLCEATPFSEDAWEKADGLMEDHACCDARYFAPWEAAWILFVRCRQSLAGRMTDFATLSRTRTRRGMNEQASAWLTAVEGLPEVHARLKRVVVLNRPALDVIRQQDGPETLFYLDPPYLHGTRSTTTEYGKYEMDTDAHLALLEVASAIKGGFLLSGYRSELYDDWARSHDWKRHDFELPNNAAGGTTKRRMTECVWTGGGVSCQGNLV